MRQDKIDYYSRQILVPQVGLSGQTLFTQTKCLVIGCGGLGSGAIPALCGSGVSLVLVDGDVVEETNLHRQTIHSTDFLKKHKVESAKSRCHAVNPYVEVQAIPDYLNASNCLDLFKSVDIVLDCTDNLPTRRLISDAADITEKPVISGSALKMQGQILIYGTAQNTSYRNLLGSQYTVEDGGNNEDELMSVINNILSPAIQDCSTAGIFGPIPQVIGLLMAIEVSKLILFNKWPDYNFITYDALDSSKPVRFIKLKRLATEPRIVMLNTIDYVNICQTSNKFNFDNQDKLTWQQMFTMHPKWREGLIIDVRPKEKSDVFALVEAECLPVKNLATNVMKCVKDHSLREHFKSILVKQPIYIYCSRGYTSQSACYMLKLLQEEVKRWTPSNLKEENVVRNEFIKQRIYAIVDNFESLLLFPEYEDTILFP